MQTNNPIICSSATGWVSSCSTKLMQLFLQKEPLPIINAINSPKGQKPNNDRPAYVFRSVSIIQWIVHIFLMICFLGNDFVWGETQMWFHERHKTEKSMASPCVVVYLCDVFVYQSMRVSHKPTTPSVRQ